MKRVYILTANRKKVYVKTIVDKTIRFTRKEDRALVIDEKEANRLAEYLSQYYKTADVEDIYKYKKTNTSYKNYLKYLVEMPSLKP